MACIKERLVGYFRLFHFAPLTSLFSSLSAFGMTVCSTTSSWRTTGTCTIPAGPASCSTWRAPDRCTRRVRTCRRPPSSCPGKTPYHWSASCCTGRRETEGRQKRVRIPRPCPRSWRKGRWKWRRK